MKAGAWPLNFWLPTTYAAATAPAAAVFAIMSKVGVYVVLRLWTLVLGPEAGPLAGFGGAWLLVGGMLTIAFGTVGVLASQSLPRLAGCSVLVSSGTLLAAIGTGSGAVIGSALFYLVSSTLGIAALFLLVELVDRLRGPGADVLAVTMEAYGEGDDEESRRRDRHRHSGHGGPPRRQLHRLRPAPRGAAAPVRLHRQVRHDGGHAWHGRPRSRSSRHGC